MELFELTAKIDGDVCVFYSDTNDFTLGTFQKRRSVAQSVFTARAIGGALVAATKLARYVVVTLVD